jgi:hypothetical protein
LTFFASPLIEEDHNEKPRPSPPIARTNWSREDGRPGSQDNPRLELTTNESELNEMPAFHRHNEATTQELFFDLCKYITTLQMRSLMQCHCSLRGQPDDLHIAEGNQ